jgi:Domain of unknown function (DUF4397)
MRASRHLARFVALAALLAGTAAVAPAASASTGAAAASSDGWVRIAHLSPKAPAMDMYLFPFGDPTHATVLRDVAYGDVSAYLALSPGEYTVAMRGFGAPASSAPALTTSFMVSAHTAYTLAALGPDPGLRVEVLRDRMTAPAGRALIRVFQASLKDPQVTVSYGTDVLARQLAFGSATSYTSVSPGTQMVRFSASGSDAATQVTLAADSVHTIVVLDDATGLKVDELTDAAGSQIMPGGGASTGFGGMAPRPADLAPWLLLIMAGAALAAAGYGRLRRLGRAAV